MRPCLNCLKRRLRPTYNHSLMEFHVSRSSRDRYRFDDALFTLTGNAVIADFYAARVFAQPNTITGSIGVFSLVPNIKVLANRNGVTFDTVKTGRYADLFSIARPRSEAELAVLQRGTDAVYDAFIMRVATARWASVSAWCRYWPWCASSACKTTRHRWC